MVFFYRSSGSNLLNLFFIRTITNFLGFLKYEFSLLDPDPGGKMNADLDPEPWA